MNLPAALVGGPVQIAYGVIDVEAAAARWVEQFGAGPFFVRHHIEVTDVLVNGVPGTFDHSSAYGQWGGLMVELVHVHDPPELAVASQDGTGLHHLAYFVDSFDGATDELALRGWPAALLATAGRTRFAFNDARSELGHLIEIYQRDQRLQGFYEMVAAAADGWDGDDAIRVLG